MNHTPISHGALVLVGDGTKALFFRNEGTPLHVNLVVERVLEQSDPPTREQGTSPPGRYSSLGGPRSAMEQTDWHQLAEDRFAHEVSSALYRLAHANAYNELVVVAPKAPDSVYHVTSGPMSQAAASATCEALERAHQSCKLIPGLGA